MIAKLRRAVSLQDHIQGLDDAPLTLVEYGDYQCPHCARAYPILQTAVERMRGNLRFVFRNFPLGQVHPQSRRAAHVAEAAAAQGKFWEMHDALYEHQRELGEELYLRLATRLGLDVERFFRDAQRPDIVERVQEDFMGGVRSGASGTPSFFLNGEKYEGPWDEASLIHALETRMARPDLTSKSA